MIRKIALTLSLSFNGLFAVADYCRYATLKYGKVLIVFSGAPDPGYRTNEYPILDTDVTFIRSVTNASLYEAGPENARFRK
jgi:hypothetical protein